MKTQIRKSVFETNSSSVHTIAISNDTKNMIIPTELTFGLGEFGWEVAELCTAEEKASYLYTALYSIDGQAIGDVTSAAMSFIKDTLEQNMCKVEFIEPCSGDWNYIDHSEGIYSFVSAILESPDTLLRYLFSEDSVVYTYNDNLDYDDLQFKEELDAKESSGDYITFRKGN